jgi:PDZ domain-containing secreted protein
MRHLEIVDELRSRFLSISSSISSTTTIADGSVGCHDADH